MGRGRRLSLVERDVQFQDAPEQDVGVVAEAVLPLLEARILQAPQQDRERHLHFLAGERRGDAGVDAGAIIGQQTVAVLDHDTPESLHQRIHAAEHKLYPECVAAIARGEISISGRRVLWKK